MKCKVFKNSKSGHEEYFIRMSNNGRVTSGIGVHKVGANWKVMFSSQFATADAGAFPVVGEIDLQDIISGAVAELVAPKPAKKTAKAVPAPKAVSGAKFQVRSGKWRKDPVTDRQLELIADLQEYSGDPIPEFTGTTKGEASDYIDKYMGRING